MNIFSVLVYCTAILDLTTGYVLLAANMEDFRSLAKQFVPDNMADEILQLARSALERDKAKDSLSQHFRNEHAVTPAAVQSKEEVTVRSIRKRLVNTRRDGTTSRYELTLDDLVEKVKQRLQSELALMASATAKKKALQHIIPSTRGPTDGATPNDSSEVQETNQSNREKSQGRYEKQPSMIKEKAPYEEERYEKKVKPRREKQTQDKRYVAEMFVAQPPKYLYKLGKPVTVKAEDIPRLGIPQITPKELDSGKQNLRQVKRIISTRRRITTTEAPNLFKGVDLVSKNDSYEDYVIPKKDEDYDEPETETVKYKTVQKNAIHRPPSSHKNNKQQEVLDVFSDEDEVTTKATEHINYEDETINYNKKKRVIKNSMVEKEEIRNNKHYKQRPSNSEGGKPPLAEPLAAVNVDHQIEPYEEQVEDPDNVEGIEQPVTEELKARSEVISYSDNKPVSQYVAPQINKNNNNNKNKKIQKPKLGTVIPKRDGYKMSSPNYLVKLPIVGEKYHFDEPIPEEDREPEKLGPMKNLKSIINGKVVLL